MEAAGVVGHLAEGAVLATLDCALFGATLFLVTRLWLIVAPVYGRRWSRVLLLFGLPVVAVAGFACRWLFAEWYGPRARPLQITAGLLAMAMLLIWLCALLVGGIRRLLHRPRRAHGRERTWEKFAMAGVTLLLGIPVWGLQVGASDSEARVAARETKRLRQRVRALEAMQTKAEELHHAEELQERKIEVVEKILPNALQVQEFMIGYGPMAESFGLAVAEWKSQEGREQSVHRAEISTRLVGPTHDLEALGAKTHRLARLVDWRVDAVTAREASVTLIVYALPRAPRKDARETCALPRTDVWLWPYAERVAAARLEWSDLCTRLESLRSTQDRADAFEAARKELLDSIDAILRLRPDFGKPEANDGETEGRATR